MEDQGDAEKRVEKRGFGRRLISLRFPGGTGRMRMKNGQIQGIERTSLVGGMLEKRTAVAVEAGGLLTIGSDQQPKPRPCHFLLCPCNHPTLPTVRHILTQAS